MRQLRLLQHRHCQASNVDYAEIRIIIFLYAKTAKTFAPPFSPSIPLPPFLFLHLLLWNFRQPKIRSLAARWSKNAVLSLSKDACVRKSHVIAELILHVLNFINLWSIDMKCCINTCIMYSYSLTRALVFSFSLSFSRFKACIGALSLVRSFPLLQN